MEKDPIVVLFTSSALFYLFYLEAYKKCNQKM